MDAGGLCHTLGDVTRVTVWRLPKPLNSLRLPILFTPIAWAVPLTTAYLRMLLCLLPVPVNGTVTTQTVL